jgi:hypothetical protein
MAFGALPERIEGALAGKPVIRFDGEASMTLPYSDDLGLFDSDYEIVMVARSSADGVQYLMGDDQPDHDQHALWINGSAGASFVPSAAAGSGSAQLSEAGSYSDGRPHLFDVRVEQGLGYLSVDGQTSPDVVSLATSGEETGLLLGSAGDPLHNFQGDLAEVLIYSASLDSGQRHQLAQHLAGQWEIVLVPEPSGHMLLALALLSLLAPRPRRRRS